MLSFSHELATRTNNCSKPFFVERLPHNDAVLYGSSQYPWRLIAIGNFVVGRLNRARRIGFLAVRLSHSWKRRCNLVADKDQV